MAVTGYEAIGSTQHAYPPSQVPLYGCRRCGAAVFDPEAHDTWHNQRSKSTPRSVGRRQWNRLEDGPEPPSAMSDASHREED